MDTLEAIDARKSVRSYNDTPVEAEKLKAVAEAGAKAACTAMAGGVHISMVSSAEALGTINAAAIEAMKVSGNDFLAKAASAPNFSPFYHAPALAVISVPEPDAMGMCTQNAACAAQNMLIAATDLGLGSCYIVSATLAFGSPEARAAAGIPEGQRVVVAVALGYSDDDAPHSPRSTDELDIAYIA